MDKIVVTTNHIESDSYLIRCLNLLFPECDIEIVNRCSGAMETYSLTSFDKGNNMHPDEVGKLANL